MKPVSLLARFWWKTLVNQLARSICVYGHGYVDSGYQCRNVIHKWNVKVSVASYIAANFNLIGIERQVGLKRQLNSSRDIHSNVNRLTSGEGWA